MASDPTELLDALVAHATRHGGDVTDILDAQARFKGEATSAELTEQAQADADAEQEAGKAANVKRAADAKAAAEKGDK
jgi:regulator of protease activity HflC (stomatin/prohibitin superfamily)